MKDKAVLFFNGVNNIEQLSTNKEYYPWIDWAKIFGLYLVTIGHGSLVSDEIRILIYSFHMPMFFVICGVLYTKRKLRETLNKSFKTIIIPYYLISSICLLYSLTILVLKHELSVLNIWKRIGAIVMGIGYETENWAPVSAPMWFVVVLLIIYLLNSISQEKHYEEFLLMLSLLLFFLIKKFNIDTLIPIDTALMAYPFFYLGFRFKKSLLNKDFFWFSLPLVCIWYMIASKNGRVDMNECSCGNSLLYFYISGFLGSFVFLNIVKKIEIGGGKEYAAGTFLLMGFNLIFVTVVTLLWQFFFPKIQITTLTGMLLGLFIMVVFIPIIRICRKHFPILLGYR